MDGSDEVPLRAGFVGLSTDGFLVELTPSAVAANVPVVGWLCDDVPAGETRAAVAVRGRLEGALVDGVTTLGGLAYGEEVRATGRRSMTVDRLTSVVGTAVGSVLTPPREDGSCDVYFEAGALRLRPVACCGMAGPTTSSGD